MGERRTYAFIDTSDRFMMSTHDYSEQYCGVITNRLHVLKPYLVKIAKERWPRLDTPDGPYLANFLKDVNALSYCVVVAAVFKEMKNCPSALDEYTGDTYKKDLPSYVSDTDILYLEDYTTRMEIEGDAINIRNCTTGLIAAVLGRCEDGKFLAEDLTLAGPPSIMYNAFPVNNFDGYLALVSGFELTSDDDSFDAVEMLRDILLGAYGPKDLMKKVVRLIVAGNTFKEAKMENDVLKKLDMIIAQIASSIDVDIMPGFNDPTNMNLPQQPLHPYLFENSCRLKTFKSTTNPYSFEIEQIRFLGTSGENVSMIKKTSELSELESLALAANSRSLAPAAGDLHGCYPFKENDPLNICMPMYRDEEFPHVIFAGNCTKFATSLLSESDSLLSRESTNEVLNFVSKNTLDLKQANVRLICIPSFKHEPSIVLINLSTLETQQILLN